jgi:DNA-binding NarL/FixJ family response regulator
MDIAWFTGDSTTWSRDATELIDLALALPPFLGLMALYSMVLTGTYLGQAPIIDRALALAGRIAAKRDFESMRVYGAAVRAMDAYYRGRLEQARVFIKDALSDTEATVSQMAAALSAPLIAAALDDATLVPPATEAVIAEARRSASSPDDAAILAASAAWSISRGALGTARADLRLALACRPRAVPYSGLPFVLAAEHLDLVEVEAFERQLDEQEMPEADSANRANAALAGAILARRRGDQQRAIALADAAAAGFRALEWPMFEARALEAADRMDEAQQLYVRCGASGKLARPALAPRPTADGDAARLSTRERAVVELVARGLSNAAIAAQLSVSVKTVEKHIAAAFAKLNVRSRAQLAAVYTRDALSAETTSRISGANFGTNGM